jgi:hypothetical protein
MIKMLMGINNLADIPAQRLGTLQHQLVIIGIYGQSLEGLWTGNQIMKVAQGIICPDLLY